MGTRTNFYKNSSISYNKHFSLSSVLQNLQGPSFLLSFHPFFLSKSINIKYRVLIILIIIRSSIFKCSAYNIATGNALPPDQPHPDPTTAASHHKTPSLKRRRGPLPPQSRDGDHDDNAPFSMSHRDYIEKRRQL